MQTVKIIICGDFRAAHPEIIKMSEEVKEIFKGSDLAVCNFEAPIRTDGAKPIPKSGPALNQSEKSPTLVKKLGFNVIQMANNHIMDYGVEGLIATLNSFKDVTTIGAGYVNEAFNVRFIKVNERLIGLCSLVQKEFGAIDCRDDHAYGAAWINSPGVPQMIKEAKCKCDFLLVLPHAGVEHTATPLPEWRRIYKSFIDCGADAVIAGHPHCPQGWELYRGKPIYYSLGDFYFDELTYDDLWYKSIIVEVIIGETVEVKEHFVNFDDKNGEIVVDNSSRIRDYIEYANQLLKDENAYNNYLNDMCAQHWVGIKYGMLRGLCGVSLRMRLKFFIRLLGCMLIGNKDEMYLLNAFQCESHRWVIERYLRNNSFYEKAQWRQ